MQGIYQFRPISIRDFIRDHEEKNLIRHLRQRHSLGSVKVFTQDAILDAVQPKLCSLNTFRTVLVQFCL